MSWQTVCCSTTYLVSSTLRTVNTPHRHAEHGCETVLIGVVHSLTLDPIINEIAYVFLQLVRVVIPVLLV